MDAGQKLLSGIPVVGGLFDNTDEQAMDQLRRNQELYGNLKTPNYKDYDPEAYQYAGDLNPEDAKYQGISEDPLLRSRQLAALDKLSGLANTGLSDVDQAGYAQAQNVGSRLIKQGTAAALQNAQARGVGGSGLEFAMREQANQDGAEQARQSAMAQAADAARMRAAYQTAYGSALSGQRDQDYRANAANSGIINQFNQLNTQAHNASQERNLGARQTVGNANVDNRNTAQQYNNTLKTQGFQNQMQKAAGQAGANTGIAQGYAAQNAANTAQRNSNTQAAMTAFGAPSAPQAAPKASAADNSDPRKYAGYA